MSMRLLGALLGLLCGVIAGTALVVMNPLTWARDTTPRAIDVPRRAYSWDNYRGMNGNVADLLGWGRKAGNGPGDDPGDGQRSLHSQALDNVRIGIIRLPSGNGSPAALAVKVSTIDSNNALWRAQLGTDDYWNIYWPGEGSVFAAGYSNFWPIARDRLWSLAGLPAADDGSVRDYALSAFRPDGAWTGVVGASGRYAGYTGEIREWWAGELDRTLGITVVPPPVVAR